MIKLCAFSDEAGKGLCEQIDALNRNGITLTELRSIDGVNVSEFSVCDATEYARLLKKAGIAVWSIGSPLGKIDVGCDFVRYTETVKHVYRLAQIFGTDKVRVFSFFNAYGKKQEVFDRLNAMVSLAKQYGLTLYHENEKEIYGDTAERVLELKQNVPALKFIYDPANYLQADEQPDKTLEALYSKTDYFHIKDYIKETGELVPAGLGDCKIEKLIGMIRGDKVLTVEPHLKLFEGYGNIDKSEMKNRYRFASNKESFDFAVNAVKSLLIKNGYEEKEGVFKTL